MVKAAARGFTLLVVVVVLLAAFASVGVFQALRQRAVASATNADLNRRFSRAQEALLSFVSATGRLPCPADPTLPDPNGVEDPAVGSATCGVARGTLPWKTIGMRMDDAYDPWGWRISYRVFQGSPSVGSLTQPPPSGNVMAGADMTLCDPSQSGSVTGVNSQGKGGVCKSDNKTYPWRDQSNGFLANKGFNVNDFGTIRNRIAYVLISHGSSGYGAYTANGTRNQMPTSSAELANISASGGRCQSGGPNGYFCAMEASGTDPADPAHFDDYISYVTTYDLITKAGRGPRCWSGMTPCLPTTPIPP